MAVSQQRANDAAAHGTITADDQHRLIGAGERSENVADGARTERDAPREATAPRPRAAAPQARTPILDEYSRDLTALARSGRIDPVIGREAEIRRVVHDPAIVEELTQDAFLRAYDGLPDLQERDRFWPWLRTICRNVASSYLRSGQNRQDDRPADPDAVATIEAIERSGAHGSVDDEVAARQLFDALRRAVAALPERQRDAILMREIEGLDYRSIAATMGLPVNTVKSLIFRGRDAIAHAIRPLMAPTRARRW